MGENQYYFLIGRNVYFIKTGFIGCSGFGLVAYTYIFNRVVVFIEDDSGNFSRLVLLGKSDATER
jgi:hypothetical protein